MQLHHSHSTSGISISKLTKSSSSTAITSRNTSTTSSTTYDETSCLLPHERHPSPAPPTTQPQHPHVCSQLRYSSSTTSSATASLHHILTLHPRQIAILEAARAQEEAQRAAETNLDDEEEMNRHVLSRIDCIEIDLWHERIRDYEAAELGLVSAAELGLVRETEDEERADVRVEVQEEDGGRLSRVQTYVNDFADVEGGRCNGRQGQGMQRRKISSIAQRFGSVSLSLNHFHPYFWVDVAGICILILLVVAFLVFIGLEIRYDKEGVCREHGGKGAAGFWVAVQMLVALGLGLVLQVPVYRGLVPFVLPLWVVGTFGVVFGFKVLAGCLGN
ncbi:unnamed protein product [Aureobasidium mustum]|uniref:Uncharacterized protein n=1 Tax=Aureobasidium mustum TaxID=2773714 RepID=A0A9N8PK52_9PEZI|nr:unnamed protein product [Aureobasidium mustum]